MPNPGELLVGAYLKVIERCDIVTYNVRPPGGGLPGLEELDVVGLHFGAHTAYLCEVTTHLQGMVYKDNPTTLKRVRKKYKRQRTYARNHLSTFEKMRFMFWSPVVPVGYLTENFSKIDGLEFIINKEYTRRVCELQIEAKKRNNDEGNDVFRLLQILAHLK